MGATKLSMNQIAVLSALMVEARELTNAELTALAGVTLTGEDRKRLVSDGLIEERRVGRTYAFQLSGEGWSTGVHMLAAQERGKGAAASTVGTLLSGINRALHARGADARSFFGAAQGFGAGTDETPPTTESAARNGSKPAAVTVARGAVRTTSQPRAVGQSRAVGAAKAAGDSTLVDVETRIRAAYAALAREPAGWVSLADVRDVLDDIPRDEQDAGLRRVAIQPGVRLIPVANLKSLTTRDSAAAVRFGGEDNHALAIEAS